MPANPERRYRSTDLSYAPLVLEANDIVKQHAIAIVLWASTKGPEHAEFGARAQRFLEEGLQIPDTRPEPKRPRR